MIRKVILLCFCFLLLINCESNKNIPIVQKLDSNWSFKQDSDTIWRSAEIPGNVHTDLMKHDLIPDPFILNNENIVQWVSDQSWIYETQFSIDEETLTKKNHQLNFEGLDSYTHIYLNDSLILKSNNAFRTFKVDIKGLLKKDNTLIKKVLSENKNEILTVFPNVWFKMINLSSKKSKIINFANFVHNKNEVIKKEI